MQKDTTLNAQSIDTTSHDGAHEALWWLDFYTTKGRRAENQDSLLVTTCLPYRKIAETIGINNQHYHAPLLVLIADGVSACQFPKQASRLVVNTVAHHLTLALENTLLDKTASTSFDDHQIASLIKIAVNKANDALYFPQVYQRVPPLLSTLSGLLCIGDRIHLFHTGDSRIYRIDINSSTVLTKDHRVHRGQDKGALSAAIGADMYIELQQSVFTLHQEECLALMTDGVYESINAAELEFELCTAARALGTSMETSKLANDISISQNLCEQAFNEGSHDNLTMIILGIKTQLLHKKKTGDGDHTNDSSDNVNNDNGNNDPFALHDIYRYQLLTGLDVGARIDGFTVVEVIARTARSEVYLVEDEYKRTFVIKSPSLNTVADGNYLREFLKERSIGLSLSKHKRAGESAYNQADPNTFTDTHSASNYKAGLSKNLAHSVSGLLRYYPVPASSHYLYHLTEYIEGESLRAFIDRHAPCDVWQTYDLLTKIGMAVRVMHRHYLLHQDIKPENILISADGAIKLIDFGSASSSILKDSTRPPNGDLHYAAPEYYSDAPKGVHSDLFSIAVIGYELLTGTRPFSSQALMNATQTNQTLILPTERLRKYRVPAASQQALLRALHPNTQARYQAIGEFLQDFNPDNASNTSEPEPLIVRRPLLVWHSICFIEFVLILSLLAYFT
ncbi:MULTISPECIES: bifunctional protein-serine/threonine kinase/phosphatase [unclassified Psychrobacter]|jgi:serine/threonine protein kinase/serine/threonine protein phosphatase PrpC|uniref:bifunctional protein-serine/threonine kinase/phosphatase n=2 Tax=Gammaproteobacteria TaxID=1236 RepID=UPI00040C6970|nr:MULTISPECIES: bifunctional protein-serine/threonine kinase/phosphatase [unclassified Psychrobacter]